ncbi:WcaA Glycosyltransferases involved in cell wall biogenesis [Candidatus Methylopumilus universalis]|uniref:glycosyltransferase family 2 protein n=1 Tax=Candidatus Methylopumilus universalis TaxID=2588536 RepID=UPI003BEEB633
MYKNPTVAILLCTYQGQKFIQEQLDSFANQTFTNWKLYVSDDHSSDNTVKIINQFKIKTNDRRIISAGPQNGFAAHFFSLTDHTNIKADFYAWSDQDDVWRKHKLMRAIRWLETQPKNRPAVFCSRTCIVDKHNKIMGFSPLFEKPKTFKNALVQNVGGGNTMVFNRKARDLFLKVEKEFEIISHDWLMYQIVTGCGGEVFYDFAPLVRYRQHDSNVVGQNNTWKARYKRFTMILKGRYQYWNHQNIEVLKGLKSDLTPSNYKTLQMWITLRQSSLIKRIYLLRKSGIYRQTFFEDITLYLAAFLGKL